MIKQLSIKLVLQDCPDWLSHIEITREGDIVELDVVKTNNTSYGHAKTTLAELEQVVQLLKS